MTVLIMTANKQILLISGSFAELTYIFPPHSKLILNLSRSIIYISHTD